MIEEAKIIYNRIKEWFWCLPVWKRVILTSSIWAIGGSLIIGFLNRYALYYYAFKQGLRIPVEGIEYLNLAVTLLSFAIILTSTIGIIIIYGGLNVMAEFFTNVFVQTEDQKKKQRIKKSVLITIALFGFLLSVITGLFIFSLSKTGIKSTPIIAKETIIVLGFVFGIIFLMSKSEGPRKTFIIGIALIAALLFNQNVYSLFLNKIQYGGKIPIVIEYRKADNTEALINGKLLIRTNKSVTIESTNRGYQEEIPAEKISKMTFIK